VKKELDDLLCKKYPKMMVNRNLHMTETCMCWGFECGDGWFNILDQLMGNIQHHIDWKVKQRESAIKYNEMVTECQAGNFDLFETDHSSLSQEYKDKRLGEIIAGGRRELPEMVPQVTLDQVKEKFGTLRFYYSGGDDYISGLVSMAESMSGVTCESCGNTGERKGGGWIKTICEPCEDKRAAEYARQTAEYKKEKETK
jgi:hypothetical protein